MADQPFGSGGEHLVASGSRGVDYCHRCETERYQDEHGLTCPRCQGEVTEMITSKNNSRPGLNATTTPPDILSLHSDNPWQDPEDTGTEGHIAYGPGGSVFISRTVLSSRRHPILRDDPNEAMTDFQQMFGTTFDPSFQSRQAGRSRPEALFAQAPFVGGFRIGGGGGSGTHMGGGRFTFTTRRVRPVDGAQSGIPLVNDLSVIIESMFGPLGDQGDYEGLGGVPLGLHGLFQALPNPADARSVDAMYEVWGQIMSIVMELHSTSDAPGPASPDAIAALPKKKLDEKMLGPEGKGECVVCMDDVHIGDEVVLLPCSHWFHEACAASWLSEHNTCPICRRGIEGETALPK